MDMNEHKVRQISPGCHPTSVLHGSRFTPHASRLTPYASCPAFTLIELILVMALLGIVIGVSAPALSNFFRGRNLDNEGRRFVALSRYAQSRAVSEGVPMVLWIDMRQGTYGAEQEPGYSLADTNARSFTLGKDLQIAAMDLPAMTRPPLSIRPMTQTDPNVPRLRFLPDGSIAESSPQAVSIREVSGDSIWIAQSRNRQSYEIVTNLLQARFR